MTRTEDRLIAALESAAAEVPVTDMRPLTAPGRTGYPHRRRVWLTALPAAASIVVIAALVALNGQRPSPEPVVAAAYIGGSEPRVPAFFVDAGSTGLYDQRLRVVSLATGVVTATEHAPPGTEDIDFLAEQAQTGNFVAGFESSQAGGVILYRFRITGTGQITPLTRIKRIIIKQQPENVAVLALAPDGSRLALSVTANTIPAPGGAADAKIIFLNLSNGARQVWSDTLADKGHYPQITSAVWAQGRQALVFATRTCRLHPLGSGCFWEFRRLVEASHGLHAGPVLLHQGGMRGETQAPAISPDGSSVVEVRGGAGAGNGASLVRISLATGSQTLLHQWSTPRPYQAGANEGNFLLIGQQLHHGNTWRIAGWVDGVGFHSLSYPRAS